eukprot:CCRYP_011375-RC/>CCRYP_011375-RC protein AED:0.49 eAED:1.00 QI:0/-1/0/1/-1/0/1/0/28
MDLRLIRSNVNGQYRKLTGSAIGLRPAA